MCIYILLLVFGINHIRIDGHHLINDSYLLAQKPPTYTSYTVVIIDEKYIKSINPLEKKKGSFPKALLQSQAKHMIILTDYH